MHLTTCGTYIIVGFICYERHPIMCERSTCERLAKYVGCNAIVWFMVVYLLNVRQKD